MSIATLEERVRRQADELPVMYGDIEAIDDPPAELVTFIESMEAIPDWIDLDVIEAGARSERVVAPLRPPFDGQWRARRGEYRVRYLIDDDAGVVTVVDIDHRRDAYHR